ncbi:MAG: hypothetical protein D6723_12435 [Acidobacteria bacterium]|nr:MAG: hypothetical protein D6723_12435 [Acidobacteriota bacterium]
MFSLSASTHSFDAPTSGAARPTTTIVHRPAMRRMANQDMILLEGTGERTIGGSPLIHQVARHDPA